MVVLPTVIVMGMVVVMVVAIVMVALIMVILDLKYQTHLLRSLLKQICVVRFQLRGVGDGSHVVPQIKVRGVVFSDADCLRLIVFSASKHETIVTRDDGRW